jgi:hypothetical protein
MSATPTPRTDKAIIGRDEHAASMVYANFTRTLERELNAAVAAGYILAMRLLQSDLNLDDEECAARDYFLPPPVPKKEPATAMEAALNKACDEWTPNQVKP